MNKNEVAKIREEEKTQASRWCIHILDTLNEEEIKELNKLLERALK